MSEVELLARMHRLQADLIEQEQRLRKVLRTIEVLEIAQTTNNHEQQEAGTGDVVQAKRIRRV